MKLTIAFREAVPEPMLTILDRIVARINKTWDKEHEIDGTHKTFTNVVRCTANGTHLFSASGTEPNSFRVRQTQAHPSTYASYDLLNDTENESAVLRINSSVATSSEVQAEASIVVLYANGTGLRLGTIGADDVDLFTSQTRRFTFDTNGHLKGRTATGGIGYGVGSGNAVTQATSKSTGVTLNYVNGTITMHGAALAADTAVSFTLTDSAIEANDVVVITHHSTGTAGAYLVLAQAAGGSATITVRNVTAGSLSEAIVLKFAVIKGSIV